MLFGGLVVIPAFEEPAEARCEGFKKNGDPCKDKKDKDNVWPNSELFFFFFLFLSASTTSPYRYVDSVPSLYKELKECISEVERIEEETIATESSKNMELTKKQEETVSATTLDGYFIHNNANSK